MPDPGETIPGPVPLSAAPVGGDAAPAGGDAAPAGSAGCEAKFIMLVLPPIPFHSIDPHFQA